MQPTQTINPNVSVDCVIFGFDENDLKVLLINRTTGDPARPDDDELALPGDLIRNTETLDQAAKRVLKELTGLSEISLFQFRAFGDPDRLSKESDVEWLKAVRLDPEARVITIAYYSLVNIEKYDPTPSGFARKAQWVSIGDVKSLAFDHDEILETALHELKWKVYREPISFELLPEKFTLAQMQRLYEIIMQTDFDKRNFRRKLLNSGYLIETKEKQLGVAHKPARLYQVNKDKLDSPDLDPFPFR
jgi:8-oxo-dGTP diphosphatase